VTGNLARTILADRPAGFVLPPRLEQGVSQVASCGALTEDNVDGALTVPEIATALVVLVADGAKPNVPRIVARAQPVW
jgi:hypothetical protein